MSDWKSEVMGQAGLTDQIGKFDRLIDFESFEVVSPVEKRYNNLRTSLMSCLHIKFWELKPEC